MDYNEILEQEGNNNIILVGSALTSHQHDLGLIPVVVCGKVRSSPARPCGFSLGTLVSSHTNDAFTPPSKPMSEIFIIVK